MPSFRFSAKNAFLTYAQCPIGKDILLDFLLDKNIAWGVIAQESHEDGNPHLHAIIGWEEKQNIRDERFFDIIVDDVRYHPNIQSPRSLKHCVKYVEKDGDTLTHGVVPEQLLRSSWGTIIANARSPGRFMKNVLATYPREYALRYQALEYMSDRHYKKTRVTYAPRHTEFRVTGDLQDWYHDEFRGDHDRRKSLILVSPTRYGKTEWARSLGHHMYFNGMVNFKSDWDEDAEYIVFDDIEWDYIPNKKGFFGAQREFTITDKYSAKRTVRWGKICIYLCNDLPDFKSMRTWIESNSVIIHLNSPLY